MIDDLLKGTVSEWVALHAEMAMPNLQWYPDNQIWIIRFQGYRFKSGISIFAWRVLKLRLQSPFKIRFTSGQWKRWWCFSFFFCLVSCFYLIKPCTIDRVDLRRDQFLGDLNQYFYILYKYTRDIEI